jgi:hypothetical protein
MTPAGKLTLRVRPQAGFAGATVSLTDHYSVSGDTKADANAVYSVKLDEKSLPAGSSHDIALEWKPGGEATVAVDGTPVSSIKPMRAPAFGINYVRVGGAGDGLTIESAKASAADSSAPLNFTKRRGNAAGGAVLDVGGPGAFDDKWATCPTVLRTRDGYRMWYSAYYNAADGRGGIGAASSSDGIRWTRENDGGPVLSLGPAGAFDHAQAFGPEVLHDGKRYLMWYTGDNGEKDATGISYYQIGLATSDDGVAWQRANDGKPVLTNGAAGAFDAVQAATPSVLRDGDGYRMWYAAWAPQSNHTICVARSADGMTWQRENDGQPVEGLDPSIAYGHSVCRVGERYVMVYMALGASRGLYGAISDDGLRWSMLNGGAPVLAPGSAEDFDANIVGHPFLLAEDDMLRCWYTGYQTRPGGIGNWALRIGCADAPIPAGLAR